MTIFFLDDKQPVYFIFVLAKRAFGAENGSVPLGEGFDILGSCICYELTDILLHSGVKAAHSPAYT
jgi:hypothetical protein